MEIDKYQKAINYFEQELIEIPKDIGFDKEVCDRCLSHVRLALAALERQREMERLRPLDEWGEDYGDVIWWRVPIEESPYVGTPLDLNWVDDYYTHWSKLPSNEVIKEWNKIYDREPGKEKF